MSRPRFDIKADEVRFLHKNGIPEKDIAEHYSCHIGLIKKILSGERLFPGNIKIPPGRKLCTCCKKELVPKKPIQNVKLTRLCAKCYKNEENDDDQDYRVIFYNNAAFG